MIVMTINAPFLTFIYPSLSLANEKGSITSHTISHKESKNHILVVSLIKNMHSILVYLHYFYLN